MTTTVSSRRQHTRDRLIDAATGLFAEKSIEGASVEEISERAGFTRGAFYSNFDSKEELCLEIVRQRGEQLLETTRRALAVIPDSPVNAQWLEEIIAKVITVLDVGFTFDDNWVLVRQELRLYAFRNPTFRPALIEVEQDANNLASEALAAALARHGASLRIPLDQLMVTLDAFCERTRVDSILNGDSDAGHSWRDGLERIVRALVVLPADEDRASAEPV
ncbi:MAG: TetR/AcrR family transcriptional regulator [Actinobacteria bacterium HGW-Actinobacteria-5]|jgi:AcrR family transcriptional regulator|nr:MAG: TetR/AcrR family transcriptional regulator [Actinobacteria bacterium HGW-Actinobacteria-5]